MRAGIKSKKIISQKSIEFGIPLKYSATCYKQKNRNISRYQTTNLMKIRFSFLVSAKGEKKDEREFVNKFVRTVVTIVFA